MERVDGRLIFSATDLINHLECPHLTHLNIEVPRGQAELESSRSDTTSLIARKGDEHERGHLAQLIEEGREVVKIESGPGQREPGMEGTRRGARETAEAMVTGAPRRRSVRRCRPRIRSRSSTAGCVAGRVTARRGARPTIT